MYLRKAKKLVLLHSFDENYKDEIPKTNKKTYFHTQISRISKCINYNPILCKNLRNLNDILLADVTTPVISVILFPSLINLTTVIPRFFIGLFSDSFECFCDH